MLARGLKQTKGKREGMRRCLYYAVFDNPVTGQREGWADGELLVSQMRSEFTHNGCGGSIECRAWSPGTVYGDLEALDNAVLTLFAQSSANHETWPSLGGSRMQASEINSLLIAKLPELLGSWFPTGRYHGEYFRTKGFSSTKSNGALEVKIDSGLWYDFTEARGGNTIGLWMEVKGQDFTTALQDIKQYLGIGYTNKLDKPQSGINLTIAQIDAMRSAIRRRSENMEDRVFWEDERIKKAAMKTALKTWSTYNYGNSG